MVPPETHGRVVDFGKVKVHPDTGSVGKVIDEVVPRGKRFSHYRLVLELVDGSRKDFLFMELRDATEQETVLYEAKHKRSVKRG